MEELSQVGITTRDSLFRDNLNNRTNNEFY